MHSSPVAGNSRVVSLIDEHVEYRDRMAYRGRTRPASVQFSMTRDGWLIAQVHDYYEPHVFLRHFDGRFQYQCDCNPFQSTAPRPCRHVLEAAEVATSEGLLDDNGVLTSRTRLLPQRRVAAVSRKRKMAQIENDGSVTLHTATGGNDQRIALPWLPHLEVIRRFHVTAESSKSNWPPGRQVIYVIQIGPTLEGKGLVVQTMFRDPKLSGDGWRKAQDLGTTPATVPMLPDPDDRQIVARLAGTAPKREWGYDPGVATRVVNELQAQTLVPMLCATGRCFLGNAAKKELLPTPLRWDDGEPWRFVVNVARDDDAGLFRVTGRLERAGQVRPLTEPVLLTAGSHVFFRDHVAALDDGGAFGWIAMLRDRGEVRVPVAARDQFFAELYRMPTLPAMTVPEELEVEKVSVAPTFKLRLKKAVDASWAYPKTDKVLGTLLFNYDGHEVEASAEAATGILIANERRLIRRDRHVETQALRRLLELGFRDEHDYGLGKTVPRLETKLLAKTIRQLTSENWIVEAEGQLYRKAGEFSFEVTSGIDWFDLTAKVDFDGQSASLPALLAAVRKGEHFVRLDDGTLGMLPEEWLAKYGSLAEIGTVEDDKLRFKRTQVGLLDALLAAQPEATFDAGFQTLRDELRAFDGVSPLEPPATFVGDLRAYQRDALGWFSFLRKFGFGGCLADDMGLGKTVQVLALLEDRRTADAATARKSKPVVRRPALVVVPRSLVFNWMQEAARFAPKLRVLDHTQPNRQKEVPDVSNADLVLATYGTLRRDAAVLKDVEFDYVILDEAHNVKNPKSESAKAVRLLNAGHRLALTGTPVQNHLGDLWSLFDFLNPGMLGAVSAFDSAGAIGQNADPESRRMLSQALRPFILRRTKDQVAKDLPAKLEQTIYCDMEPQQRKLYNELREHYRASLLKTVDEKGLANSKILIIEALLRLRQAACHPGLIDIARKDDGSAKLDMIVPRLVELHEEGHKVLVFSQFTSFLSLLKKRLDKEKIGYEYLDGKTRDRQAKVEHFQTDPDCKLFLISLKAGGVGLNLTAAEYVFLLDPWWNPAIEAQAIDRTHRIGQTKQVFACRLITRDSVEEKVLALQESKRELADAIINADNSLIRMIGRNELELLLG